MLNAIVESERSKRHVLYVLTRAPQEPLKFAIWITNTLRFLWRQLKSYIKSKGKGTESWGILMASKSCIKGTLKRTEQPSKQELEWNATLPSNIVPTPDHYGPYPRQTTETRQETFLSSLSVSHLIYPSSFHFR
jgi:hypothetical protein